MDVVGRFLLADGTSAKALTVLMIIPGCVCRPG